MGYVFLTRSKRKKEIFRTESESSTVGLSSTNMDNVLPYFPK